MYKKFEKFGLNDYPPEIRGRFNSFITTQFDDSLSVEMQLRSIIKWAKDNFDETVSQTNHLIDFINDLIEYMNEFIDTFDDRYQETILDKMQEWYDNGELETLINESLDTKYHQMDERLNTQMAQKVSFKNSLEDMKKDTSLKEGEVVETLGYYQKGDGGGAKYVMTADTSNSDGGKHVPLENGLIATMLITNGRINVKQFGARGKADYKGADGKLYEDEQYAILSDDTFAFVSAIRALVDPAEATFLERGDSILFVPEGRYHVNNVELPNGMTLEGSGYWYSMIRNTSDYAFRSRQTFEFGPGSIIRGLNFAGDGDVYPLYINRTGVHIEDCWFNGTSNGIRLNACSDIEINSCIFDMTPRAINILNSQNTNIHDNVFFLQATQSIDITGSNNIIINNNLFNSIKGSVIKGTECKNMSVSNNNIKYSSEFEYLVYGFRFDYGENIKISNNNFFSAKENFEGMSNVRAIYIGRQSDSSKGKLKDLVVENNSISGSNGGIIVGQYVMGTVLIQNNFLQYTEVESIYTQAPDTIIKDNVIRNTNQSSFAMSGINVVGPRGLVKNNQIRSDLTLMKSAIEVDSDFSAVLENNDVGTDNNYSSGKKYTLSPTTVLKETPEKAEVVTIGTEHYIKHSNGIYEQWGNITYDSVDLLTTNANNQYISTPQKITIFNTLIEGSYHVDVTLASSGVDGHYVRDVLNNSFNVIFYRTTANTMNISIKYSIKGRWK